MTETEDNRMVVHGTRHHSHRADACHTVANDGKMPLTIENCKDDCKFINTNEFTEIRETNNIVNVKLMMMITVALQVTWRNGRLHH